MSDALAAPGLDPALLARSGPLTAKAAHFQALALEKGQEFEQVFLSEMLNPIFSTLSTEEPFGGGQAEETWRGMLVEKYAGMIARSGGIGIAEQVARELIAIQEGGRG